MKSKILGIAVGAAMAIVTGTAGIASAQTPPDVYELKKLDKFGSCKLGTVQEQNAEYALSHLKAFNAWKIKDQMVMLHPDIIFWHSSLAGLLESYPQLQSTVPFKMGQYDRTTVLETLAFLAYHNDIDQYRVAPSRLDCVGDDTVIIMTEFNGMQIQRDKTTGCITHQTPFGSPTKLQFTLKDYQKSPSDPSQRLISRVYSNLDDTVSVQVRKNLAQIAKGPPNVPPNPATCHTEAEILADFQAQAK